MHIRKGAVPALIHSLCIGDSGIHGAHLVNRAIRGFHMTTAHAANLLAFIIPFGLCYFVAHVLFIRFAPCASSKGNAVR